MSVSNALLRAVLRENRQSLCENLLEALAAADYIFEQGFLSRQDYNEVECIANTTDRARKLIDILETKDNETLDALISYFETAKEISESDNIKQNISSLVNRLRNTFIRSCNQFPSEIETIRRKGIAKQLINRTASSSTPNTATSREGATEEEKNAADPNDFSVTAREAKVVQQIIVKYRNYELAVKKWLDVARNMNGLELEDHDAIQIMLRGDHKWEDVIAHTLTLWIKKNGKNATFFSLVGVFQEVHFYDISDSLLDKKCCIQNPK